MSEQSNPKQSQPDSPRDRVAAEFASQAEQASPGMIVEFIDFLKDNKKWWLLAYLGGFAAIRLAIGAHVNCGRAIYLHVVLIWKLGAQLPSHRQGSVAVGPVPATQVPWSVITGRQAEKRGAWKSSGQRARESKARPNWKPARTYRISRLAAGQEPRPKKMTRLGFFRDEDVSPVEKGPNLLRTDCG